MLGWLWEMLSTQSVANTVLVLSLVAAVGLALGSVPLGGISLGILGIILSMLLLRRLFHTNPAAEAKVFEEKQRGRQAALVRRNLRVDNPNLEGLTIRQIPGIERLGVVISRIQHLGEEEVRAAHADSILHVGDLLLAVSPADKLAQLQVVIGSESAADLLQALEQ